MPTVLRIGPYRFYFYPADRPEPPHIHVKRDDAECKFWLSPVSLARNQGFTRHEIGQVEKIVQEYERQVLEAWNAAFHERHP